MTADEYERWALEQAKSAQPAWKNQTEPLRVTQTTQEARASEPRRLGVMEKWRPPIRLPHYNDDCCDQPGTPPSSSDAPSSIEPSASGSGDPSSGASSDASSGGTDPSSGDPSGGSGDPSSGGSDGSDPDGSGGDGSSSNSSSSGCNVSASITAFAGGPCDAPFGETIGTITVYASGSVTIPSCCSCSNGECTLTIGGSTFIGTGFSLAGEATVPCSTDNGGAIGVSFTWSCTDGTCNGASASCSVPVDGTGGC